MITVLTAKHGIKSSNSFFNIVLVIWFNLLHTHFKDILGNVIFTYFIKDRKVNIFSMYEKESMWVK